MPTPNQTTATLPAIGPRGSNLGVVAAAFTVLKLANLFMAKISGIAVGFKPPYAWEMPSHLAAHGRRFGEGWAIETDYGWGLVLAVIRAAHNWGLKQPAERVAKFS